MRSLKLFAHMAIICGDGYKLVEYSEDDRRWYAEPMGDEEWAELAQQEISSRENSEGVSRYDRRLKQFGKERHDSYFGIAMLSL